MLISITIPVVTGKTPLWQVTSGLQCIPFITAQGHLQHPVNLLAWNELPTVTMLSAVAVICSFTGSSCPHDKSVPWTNTVCLAEWLKAHYCAVHKRVVAMVWHRDSQGTVLYGPLSPGQTNGQIHPNLYKQRFCIWLKTTSWFLFFFNPTGLNVSKLQVL